LLAQVFPAAVGRRDTWETALKGFQMIESPLVREWKDAARRERQVEGKADALLRVVKGKYKGVAEQVTQGSAPVVIPRHWTVGWTSRWWPRRWRSSANKRACEPNRGPGVAPARAAANLARAKAAGGNRVVVS
jgi:hypothetical protein